MLTRLRLWLARRVLPAGWYVVASAPLMDAYAAWLRENVNAEELLR